DALLLLYLSAGALARLSTVPDGLIVLSADGYEPESSIGQGITAAMERGIPLLGVVRERWTPLATPAPPSDPRAVAPPPGRISAATRPGIRAGASHRLARPVVVAVTLAAGTAGGWALLARGAEQRAPVPAAPASATRTAAPPASAAPRFPRLDGATRGLRAPGPRSGARRPARGGRHHALRHAGHARSAARGHRVVPRAGGRLSDARLGGGRAGHLVEPPA